MQEMMMGKDRGACSLQRAKKGRRAQCIHMPASYLNVDLG